ncbi:hypothetical protein HYPSUDRAFT_58476 [Hypholoma sublateritium FD-334 SS-4]|uniref:Uncharacterized protein n=1 Tax=Hypholoma sublateritium (strain FD-334 SS-4) TaxID=945553 RepID=A0A0D2KMZ7_HYPSF|nr:hypothetical protein HYPSUDRAFT_58476 [Hypholoma sublateritium FD-334 SS-4]
MLEEKHQKNTASVERQITRHKRSSTACIVVPYMGYISNCLEIANKDTLQLLETRDRDSVEKQPLAIIFDASHPDCCWDMTDKSCWGRADESNHLCYQMDLAGPQHPLLSEANLGRKVARAFNKYPQTCSGHGKDDLGSTSGLRQSRQVWGTPSLVTSSGLWSNLVVRLVDDTFICHLLAKMQPLHILEGETSRIIRGAQKSSRHYFSPVNEVETQGLEDKTSMRAFGATQLKIIKGNTNHESTVWAISIRKSKFRHNLGPRRQNAADFESKIETCRNRRLRLGNGLSWRERKWKKACGEKPVIEGVEQAQHSSSDTVELGLTSRSSES